jgi:hypothetical protein
MARLVGFWIRQIMDAKVVTCKVLVWEAEVSRGSLGGRQNLKTSEKRKVTSQIDCSGSLG